MRTRFDLPFGAPLEFIAGGRIFTYDSTAPYAVIGHVSAGIEQEVRRAQDGTFVWLTVIADESDMTTVHGVHHGWYVAEMIDAERAEKLRRSWAVLRPQANGPLFSG